MIRANTQHHGGNVN